MDDDIIGLGGLDGGHGLFLKNGGIHKVFHTLDALVELREYLHGLQELLHGLSAVKVASRDVGGDFRLRRVSLVEHFS
jgi:hypothetical protein